MPERFLYSSGRRLRSARGRASSRLPCLCPRSSGGFSMRKDSCTNICWDTQSILGKCGIDCCRLSGRSVKCFFVARKPKSLAFSVDYYISFEPPEFFCVYIPSDLCAKLLNTLVGTVVFEPS